MENTKKCTQHMNRKELRDYRDYVINNYKIVKLFGCYKVLGLSSQLESEFFTGRRAAVERAFEMAKAEINKLPPCIVIWDELENDLDWIHFFAEEGES
jgi:hypothetical protein